MSWRGLSALRGVGVRPTDAEHPEIAAIACFASRFPGCGRRDAGPGPRVNAAIFSLTREVLLRPLPYRDADRLVRVFEVSRALGVASAPIAPVNYIAWRDLVDAFEQTAVFRALLRAPASSERACPESLERDRLTCLPL